MSEALVILSGGQDSTTCLFWARDNFNDVVAISFDYGQKHKLELDCAAGICQVEKIEHHVLKLPLLNEIAENALTRDDIKVDKQTEIGKLPNTFVDGRNMLFLTYAAIFAKQRGIKNLVTGVCQTDYSGYPDCREDFILSIQKTLCLAMDYNFRIQTPLMNLSKSEIWKLADDLNVIDTIKNATLTCYNGIMGTGCKECPACILRKKGLEEYYKLKEI